MVKQGRKKNNPIVVNGKEYKGQGWVRPFIDHLQISGNTLKSLKDQGGGHYHYIMITMTFAALSMEAYLNHIGRGTFKSWDEIDSRLNPKGKLMLLQEKLEFEADFSKRPFQTFPILFKYRNWIVHSKSEVVTKPVIDKKSKIMPVKFLTNWEKLTTMEMAERFNTDLNAMLEIIHAKQTFDILPPYGVRGGAFVAR